MSGELKATEGWVRVEPFAAKPEKERRRRKPPPQTALGILLDGLRRFVLFAGAICAALVLGTYLFVVAGGGRFVHVLTLAFYFAGAFIGLLAFVGGTGGMRRNYRTWQEREQGFNLSFVFIFFSALMFGIGVALETFA